MLDLVFVDDIDIISNLEITTRLVNSDHLSIELTLDDSLDCYNPRHDIKRNFYRGDYVKAKCGSMERDVRYELTRQL